MPAKKIKPFHKESHKTAFQPIAKSSSSITTGVWGREYTNSLVSLVRFFCFLNPVSADVWQSSAQVEWKVKNKLYRYSERCSLDDNQSRSRKKYFRQVTESTSPVKQLIISDIFWKAQFWGLWRTRPKSQINKQKQTAQERCIIQIPAMLMLQEGSQLLHACWIL